MIRASAPAVSRSAIAAPLRRRPSMSALITRASISSVAPGRVAIRAPASVAALRAAVCESDCTVGQRTTSAAAIAAATEAGGSVPCVSRSAISARTPSASARPASPRRRSPSPIVAGLATTSTSSPGRTPRQSRITAATARSRSLIDAPCLRLRFSLTFSLSWPASPPSGAKRTSALTFALPFFFSFLASLPFGFSFSVAEPGPAATRFVFRPLPVSSSSPGARRPVTSSFAVPFFLLRLSLPSSNGGPSSNQTGLE